MQSHEATARDDRVIAEFVAAGNNEKVKQADQLVTLALDLFEIRISDLSEPFAVRRDRPGIALMFKGARDALRSTLAKEFRQRHGKTPSATALADAMMALQGEALDADPEPVHLRVARHGDGIVIDLGRQDGQVVLVRPASWEVLDRSPVIFRRTVLAGELPLPERGGDVEQLHDLLNVNTDTFPLVLAWLVASYLPNIAHPVLMLGGEQGSGKTSVVCCIGSLIDPSPAQVRSQPNDPEGWCMAASGSWLVAVDNVSVIKGWWSDCLCKAVTGDGWVRRKLYTDSDLAVLAFRRVVALTSIDAGALRGDLGDRILLADLDPIPASRRRSETELGEAFGRARPLMLGAVLDLLGKVLAALPQVRLKELPRMADFAKVVAALDDIRGTNALDLYLHQGDRVVREVLEADAVAGAITSLGNFTGTAAELLRAIAPEPRAPQGWPTNPRALVARLKRLVPALRQTGIRVHFSRTNRARTIEIEKVGTESSPPSFASLCEGKPSDAKVTIGNLGDDGPDRLSRQHPRGIDASDGGDDLLPPLTVEGSEQWEAI